MKTSSVKNIIVMRTGSVLSLDSSVETSSPLGEYRDTVGMINYLLSAGYRVICFGRVRGSIDNPNLVAVNVDTRGIDPYSSKEDTDAVYDEACNRLVAACGDDTPTYCLNPVGYRATMAYNNNPYGMIVQQVALRYTAPAFYAMEKLKLHRVILVTDIRNYPQDSDMLFWGHVRPVAVLSQENHEYKYKSRGHHVQVKAVYAGLENFWLHGFTPVKPGSTEKLYDVGVFAHTHLKDGRIKKGRNDAWLRMYKACDYIHGHGWELFEGNDGIDPRFGGLLKDSRDMFTKLQSTTCGPMISMRPSFNSCKLGLYAWNDCLPLPFGRGDHRNTYDGEGRYVTLNSDLRVTSDEDIKQVVHRCKMLPSWRDEWVRCLQEYTRPNFQLLESCMNDIETADVNSDEWVNTYGGYRYI